MKNREWAIITAEALARFEWGPILLICQFDGKAMRYLEAKIIILPTGETETFFQVRRRENITITGSLAEALKIYNKKEDIDNSSN